MDGWLGESGISEESGDILGGDGDVVGTKFVFRPLRPGLCGSNKCSHLFC